MKKAIVPLTLIVFIILTVFVYINRFSIYYETKNDVYVFDDDTISSNLTSGVTADSDDVTIAPVKMSEKIYLSNQRYFIGESSKKNISLEYPITSDDNSTLYIQSDFGKYVDSDFTKKDVMVDTVITNATLYNGNSYMQVDDMVYYFLELNSGVYVNLLELTINTATHPYIIPAHSYIYFGDHYIRYYYRNEEGKFIYRLIPSIEDLDEVSIGGNVYTYKDFLLLLGIRSIDAIIEEDPVEPAIEPEDKNKSKDTLKKRGKLIETERYTIPTEVKYVDPEVHITNLVVGVYSVKFDVEIYDPARRIVSAPQVGFCKKDACPKLGAEQGRPIKSLNSSGYQIITGLEPDTFYGMRVSYTYKNEKGTEVKDVGHLTSKQSNHPRVTINEVPLLDFGNPYEYPIHTKDTSSLNPITVSWNNPIPTIKSITWDNIKATNPEDDEVLYGVSALSVYITSADGSKKLERKFSQGQINKFVKGEEINFDSTNILDSNTVYNLEIVAIDTVGTKLTIVNGIKNGVRTLQSPPNAVLTLSKDNSNDDYTTRLIDIRIENKDNVTFLTPVNSSNRFRYEVYTIKDGVEQPPVIKGTFDDPNKANSFTKTITLERLSLLTRYYVRVYCDYSANGYENGNQTTVTYPNYLMNKDFSFVTGDISSLGMFVFEVSDLVVESNNVKFRASFQEDPSPKIKELIDEDINIKIYRFNSSGEKEYVTHLVYENGIYVETEDYYVSKRIFSINDTPDVNAEFNINGEIPDFLQSNTDYKIEIIPTILSGEYELNHNVINGDFTTLKRDAVVKILNAYKAAGYVDFDVCISDPDGAVRVDAEGNSDVDLIIKNKGNTLESIKIPVVSDCEASDGLYRRIIFDRLDKNVFDYDFLFSANNYNINPKNDASITSKYLYVNSFKIGGAYGVISLDKMIDASSYDLDLKDPNVDGPDYINRFDITNGTRWKGATGSSSAYDRKELMVDENTVKLGSNLQGYYGYSLYIPELIGKPFTISFEADVTRDSTLSRSEQEFCINNGYNYSSCSTAGAAGTGNIISSITVLDDQNVVQGEKYSVRHWYTFASLDRSGYITFFVKDTNKNRYNTNVFLRNLKIEYGHKESEDDELGNVDPIRYGGELPDEFVAFVDTGLGEKYCPPGKDCSSIYPQAGNTDDDELIDEQTRGIPDGTYESVSNYGNGSGIVYFNNWAKYDYYIRFFQNGNEVYSLRKKIMPVCENTGDDSEEDTDCFVNDFETILKNYDYINAFAQEHIQKDSSYELRITTVASSDLSSFDSVTDNYYLEDGTERFRLYDIYKYNFTTEIEYRAIRTPEDFMNMHAYGNYIVINDLDFTNYSGSSASAFSGTFQGSIDFQGHKLVMTTGTKLRYLFSTLGGGARVKNLDLHIIFNHKSNVLSAFQGVADSNYGQILNLMVTTVNDTIDPERLAEDDDLQYLTRNGIPHVEFSYDIDNGLPTGIVMTDEGTTDYLDGYNANNTVSSNSFRTTYFSLVSRINYGLIDGFVIKLKDPLYLHTHSALIMNPHGNNAVNQGTIRNGYVYGQDIVAPIATNGEGRSLSIIATTAAENAVIENIYSIINIRMYDNEIPFENRTGENRCLQWETNQNMPNGYYEENGACYHRINEEESESVSLASCRLCIKYVQSRKENQYNSYLVMGSATDAIVRNIISYGDILGYSNDHYDTSFVVNNINYSKDEIIIPPLTGTSQDSTIANIYTRDSSVGSATGSNVTDIYNVSDYSYKASISKPIIKAYFKNVNFLKNVLNTHGAFDIEGAYNSKSFPHLIMPACMPAQDFVSIDKASTEDVLEIMSVDGLTQDSNAFISTFSNSQLYKRYAAEVKMTVRVSPGRQITNITVEDINDTSATAENIAVEWGGQPTSDGIGRIYVYIKDLNVYKSNYYLKGISYIDNGTPKYKEIRMLLPMPLFKEVESISDIRAGLDLNTVNFKLVNDIDCTGNSCNNGEKPYIDTTYMENGEKKAKEIYINGAGHTIKNLSVNNCLINELNGTLENLSIENFTNHYSDNGYQMYGGLVCNMNTNSVINGVHMTSVISGAGGTGNLYVGGIVGYSAGGFIMNSSVNGFRLVDPERGINNLVRMNNASTLYLGGIVGRASNLIVSNSFVRRMNVTVKRYSANTDPITYGTGDAKIGGIIGSLGYGNIEDVYSTGDITSDHNSIGGIAGESNGYIKNCISKVNLVGTDYIGGIVGTTVDAVIPSNKIAKTLALGDILTISSSNTNVRRTSGSLIAMNGNYAFDKQSINSVYTQNTSGETLLSQDDLQNPIVFSSRVGLSDESWVLNFDYNCELSTDGSSRCKDTNHFGNAFRYDAYIDTKDVITENEEIESVDYLIKYGYIPMLKNAVTGEVLPNQGFYPDEPGYDAEDKNQLADLEIRFVKMFEIKNIEAHYYENGNSTELGFADRYRADYVLFNIHLDNPNHFTINQLTIDGMIMDTLGMSVTDDGVTTIIQGIKGTPKRYLDSYQITDIQYSTGSDGDKHYVIPILLNITFYGKINNANDWNNIIPGLAQNYLVTGDIDFECFTKTCNVATGLTFSKLKGEKVLEGGVYRNPVLKNIKVEGMAASNGLIENVTIALNDVDFENIYLQTPYTGTNFGIIKILDGELHPSEVNEVNTINFKNIRISAPNVSRVGIIGTNRSNMLRDVVATNINVSGKTYVGGLIGYSELRNKTNVNINNVYVYGSENYVGGYMGAQPNSKSFIYDNIINVNGAYVYGKSYVGGAIGSGSGEEVVVKGLNESFPSLTYPILTDNIADNVRLNIVYGTGAGKKDGYVGGVIGNMAANSCKKLYSSDLNITGKYLYNGGVAGSCSKLSYASSSFNNVHGANRTGGICGQISDAVFKTITVAGSVTSDNEYAGGIVGSMGWTSTYDNQVTVYDADLEDANNQIQSTIVKGKTYVGGVVGGMIGRKGHVYNNISNAIVVSTGTSSKGYAGGIVGYIGNNNEIQNNTYVFKIYGNYVENSVISSDTSYAGGLIGGWYKNSTVGSTNTAKGNAVTDSRIYSNSISASIYCKDVSKCGFINGGSGLSGGFNGDYLGTSNYTVNTVYPHYYQQAGESKGCPEGYTLGTDGLCYSNSTEETVASVTYHDCSRKTNDHFFSDKKLTKPISLISVPDVLPGSYVSGIVCNWSYAEKDMNYPYVYRDIYINEDSVLGRINANGTIDAYSLKNVPEGNLDHYDIYHGASIYTGKVLRDGGTGKTYHESWGYVVKNSSGDFVSKNLNNHNGLKNYSGSKEHSSNSYYPYMSNVANVLYRSSSADMPDNYIVSKTFNYPSTSASYNIVLNAIAGISNIAGLPRVSVYAVDVNKINVEFSNIYDGTWFEINGQEYSIDRNSYTFYYDFEEDFDIEIGNRVTSETIHINADDVVNNSTTIDDNYYYLDDGTIITNADLKSNGYEEIVDDSEEESEEEIPTDSPELPIQPEEELNNIDSGLVTTSTRNNNNVIYKLAEVEKTTEINNATNIFGDQILLDNKNVYNIKTGKTKIDDFDNLTLADDKPKYEFNYAGQSIKTYDNYSVIDGEVIKKQLYVKNNKLEVIDVGLDAVGNSYIIDNYNDKEYLIYLGNDGKIHSLKDQIVLPKNFKNINIKRISTTVGTNTSIMFVEYKDGSYVAFNYRNGNIVGKETNKDVSLGEYIREYYQLSKEKNNYTEENASYLEAKALVNKLNAHPIETVVGDSSYYGGIPAKNSTYTIAYNPATNDYSVYQMPTSESSSDLKVSNSFNETVDSMIDRDEKLIKFYREGESTKVTFVSALLIVVSIVVFIVFAIIILAKYLEKTQKKMKEGN